MKYVLTFLFLSIPVSIFGASATMSVSPSTIQSGQIISVTYGGSDVSGYNAFIACASGVKVTYTNGSGVPCDTKFSVSDTGSGATSFLVTNTSGTTKNILFRITPRDISGVEQDSLAENLYVSVLTVPFPITSFTTNSTNNIVATTTTLTWTSVSAVEGTNILFSCVEGISLFSGTTALPCGVPVFTSVQPAAGSATFSVVNKNTYNTSLKVQVFPGTAQGVYDLTHSQHIELLITPPIREVPKISHFTVPSTVSSGELLTLSWGTVYAKGVNIRMLCTEKLSATFGTSTQAVPCNTYMFSSALGPHGSTTITLTHAEPYTIETTLVLGMEIATSTYDGVYTASARVKVIPKGTTAPTSVSSVGTPKATTTAVAIQHTSKYVFKKLLKVGSRGADVTALQQMLAKDVSIYPEGLVTGYFGTGTRKAVERLQIKYGVTTVGGPGYGQVGPATRTLLNSL